MQLSRPKVPTTRQTKGLQAEDMALGFLQKKGLKLLYRNYHCRMGELDLVMKDKTHLVFIEVRSRSASQFGGALASITYHKQQKIIRAAQHYLQYHRIYEQYPLRFDVMIFDGDKATPQWIQNAFHAGDY